MKRTVNLCDSGCCPVVEITETAVKIGEAGNLCTLSIAEWNTLKEKVRRGDL
jgi:hypothetical protein